MSGQMSAKWGRTKIRIVQGDITDQDADAVVNAANSSLMGGGGGEPATLAECYSNSLRIAAQNGLRSVAFPSISTGAYGYPVREASRVALKAVKSCVESNGTPEEVTFVLYSENDFKRYIEALEELD